MGGVWGEGSALSPDPTCPLTSIMKFKNACILTESKTLHPYKNAEHM